MAGTKNPSTIRQTLNNPSHYFGNERNVYGHNDIFRSYGERKKRIEDSSAFEHIFVGESRDGAILGFHNWLRFYQLESLGYIDYRGYYVSIDLCGKSYGIFYSAKIWS